MEDEWRGGGDLEEAAAAEEEGWMGGLGVGGWGGGGDLEEDDDEEELNKVDALSPVNHKGLFISGLKTNFNLSPSYSLHT